MEDTPQADEGLMVGDCQVEVTTRSLADLGVHVDALVSSDDNYLSHGGGVSHALWHAGGEEQIGEDVATHSGNRVLGDIVITRAGRLQAKAIFHAITIDFDRNRRLTPSQLSDVFARVFALAEERSYGSVGLPLLASGGGRISPQASASALARAVQDYLASPSRVRHIVVAAPDDNFTVARDALLPLTSWDQSFADFLWLSTELLDREAPQPPPRVASSLRDVLESGSGSEWAIAVALFLDEAYGAFANPGANAQMWTDVRLLRNELAHGPVHARWDAEITKALIGVVKAGLTQLVEDAPTTSEEPPNASPTELLLEMRAAHRRSLPTVSGPLFDPTPTPSQARAEPPEPIRPSSEASVPAQEGSHVRRLLRLLLDQFATDDRLKNRMDRLLLGRGYQGDFELRLLEYCIRIEEPVRLLTGTFNLATLHALYEKVVGQTGPDDADSGDLAKEVLRSLGFPEAAECHGPRQVREFIKQAEQSVRVNGLSAASSAVQDVARQLEYLCHVLLRFICQAAFGEAPEKHLSNRGSIKKPGDLARSGLGGLLIFTEQVIDDLRTAGTPKAVILQRDLGQSSLPEGKEALSGLRNSFSHFRPGAPVASEQDALAFFKQADRLVDALTNKNGRLLPIVISIQSLHIDRWGRRTVRAINDEGMDETIFTDEAVNPGDTYLMYPLSNPLRVDPILIPAGDVIWRD